jgi:hypothetical protein
MRAFAVRLGILGLALAGTLTSANAAPEQCFIIDSYGP